MGFITIGTGNVTGVYYPAGGAIARLVNKGREDHNIRACVDSTDGSVYNLSALRTGELDFAIMQTDCQYHGYNGTGKFSDQGPYKQLRFLFSLHKECFNIIARPDSYVDGIHDLKGKRVNVGSPGGGDLFVMGSVMDAMGWTTDSFKLAAELKPSEESQALYDNKIDAYIAMVGHPNGSVKESTTFCDAKVVPATGSEIDKIVSSNPYYMFDRIPAETYRGTDEHVNTFSTTATLVSTSDVPDEVAYNVVKSVFDNFETFKRLHPALAYLKKEDMVKLGGCIPLHPGAEKYYKEVGLLK
mmetsp:Transcript_1061/g.1488  ORF Transcript_1061/g.1488 Transcript_1061/m.1488 type:complete len:299 (-) Transcript_1061:180-1076(-)